jgi:autotransporter-associated beta strand protein
MRGLPVILALVVTIQSAYAGSATWNLNPISNDWNTAANWTPATVPDDPSDTATFDVSNITAISQAGVIDVAEIIFNPGASAFTISVPGTLNIDVTGITNNSGLAQNFVAPGLGASIHFYNNATAGESTVFTQQGPPSVDVTQIAFHDTSSAGSATFVSHGNAQAGSGTRFFDSATAANATFFNRASSYNYGLTSFYNASTAGIATFICEGASAGNYNGGHISFYEDSSAEHATIVLNGSSDSTVSSAVVEFNDMASAGNAAVIVNGGTARGAFVGFIPFKESASAGNASFIINGGTNGGKGGQLLFEDAALGGTAQVKLFDNGTLDLSDHDPGTVSLGSIAGTGLVLLGNTNLIVGTNNFNTAFAGNISDSMSPPGASLTKTGSGNFALFSSNTYHGGTVVQGSGSLFVNNLTGSGTGTGTVQVNSGGLAGNGIISGAVVVGDGSAGAARFRPGEHYRSPGVLTIGQALTFNADASYVWLLDTVRAIASSVVTQSVTIVSAALFSPAELQSGVLRAGTVFTVINNNGTAPIVGRFSNLPDSSRITVGRNTYQANYEGGDGNDLTLTVVR